MYICFRLSMLANGLGWTGAADYAGAAGAGAVGANRFGSTEAGGALLVGPCRVGTDASTKSSNSESALVDSG